LDRKSARERNPSVERRVQQRTAASGRTLLFSEPNSPGRDVAMRLHKATGFSIQVVRQAFGTRFHGIPALPGIRNERRRVSAPRNAGSAGQRGVLASVLAAMLLAFAASVAAQFSYPVDVYLFWGQGCPHCEREIEFLRRLAETDKRVRVHYLEVTRNDVHRRAFQAVGERLGLKEPAVPLTLVGDAVVVGFGSDATTGAELVGRVNECIANGCKDVVAPILQEVGVAQSGAGVSRAEAATDTPKVRKAVPTTIDVPFFGSIRTADLSLPALTVVLAALDGFNPCAMWVLVFLIGLLLGMQDRARMWVLGTAFIAGSAIVYFLFMAAWLNFLLFVGAVVWVRVAVALVALGGGLYYLREYFRNPEGVCKVTAPEGRKRVFDSLRRLTAESRFWVALLGILALAFAVNLVELICSAGIPAIYTQVLALTPLPRWQYYAYLVLYIVVFMLDDLIVFILAMKTLQLTGVAGGYSRFSHLAGGIVLLAIGALLLLRPEWLMFG
jgi:thiol-disulfide isomerase/thioredoxin